MTDADGVRVGRVRAWLRRRWVRVAVRAGVAVLVLAGLTMGGAWLWIRGSVSDGVYTVASAPAAPVGIVLGAGVNADGTPKPYLTNRLQDAAALYASGKVRVLLVTGDNSSVDYDEVTAMRTWLTGHGVPADKIVGDYAGFDTYDSCARAKRIFGVDRATVITQEFHVRRAIYLCRSAGIDATGVASAASDNDFRYQVREVPASVKAVLDGIFQPDPYFLGNQEPGVRVALAAGH